MSFCCHFPAEKQYRHAKFAKTPSALEDIGEIDIYSKGRRRKKVAVAINLQVYECDLFMENAIIANHGVREKKVGEKTVYIVSLLQQAPPAHRLVTRHDV